MQAIQAVAFCSAWWYGRSPGGTLFRRPLESTGTSDWLFLPGQTLPADALPSVASPLALGANTLEGIFLAIFRAQESDCTTAQWKIRRRLLALDGGQDVGAWPSQTGVATALSVSPTDVHLVLIADRERWTSDAWAQSLRDEVFEQLSQLGGVATIVEMADLVTHLRPPAGELDPTERRQIASAVMRATAEAEHQANHPRFQVRRVAGKQTIACSRELALFAERLGRSRTTDDMLRPSNPDTPGVQPISDERRVELAVAMGGSTSGPLPVRQADSTPRPTTNQHVGRRRKEGIALLWKAMRRTDLRLTEEALQLFESVPALRMLAEEHRALSGWSDHAPQA